MGFTGFIIISASTLFFRTRHSWERERDIHIQENVFIVMTCEVSVVMNSLSKRTSFQTGTSDFEKCKISKLPKDEVN
jgi:hypothetical protein